MEPPICETFFKFWNFLKTRGISQPLYTKTPSRPVSQLYSLSQAMTHKKPIRAPLPRPGATEAAAEGAYKPEYASIRVIRRR